MSGRDGPAGGAAGRAAARPRRGGGGGAARRERRPGRRDRGRGGGSGQPGVGGGAAAAAGRGCRSPPRPCLRAPSPACPASPRARTFRTTSPSWTTSPSLSGDALDLAAVHEDAVGAAGVADDEAVRPRLHDRVAARALRVVQDEVAGRVAADDGDACPGASTSCDWPVRVSDLEPQTRRRRETCARRSEPGSARILAANRSGRCSTCAAPAGVASRRMITADPQRRAARLAELHGGARAPRARRGPRAAPGLRARRLRGDARPRRARPVRRRRWPRASWTTSASWSARCRPPPSSTGPARHPRGGAQPGRGGRVQAGAGGRAARRRSRSSRRTPSTRPSSSRASRTTSARRACASSPPSTPSSPCGASGSASSGIGGPHEEGSQGGLLPLPDRARRLQGAAAPHRARDLLGAEVRLHRRSRTSRTCCATVRELGPRLREPPRPGRGDVAVRARLPRLAARRQLHLPGHGEVPHRAATACADRVAGERHRRLHRPRACCPWCSRASWRRSRPTSCPTPSDHRIVDIDYCNNAIGHLPPRADRRHRDPASGAQDGELRGGDAAAGPPGQGRLHAEGRRHPAAEGEARLAPGQQRGARRSRTRTARSARCSTASPSASSSTPTRPSLKDDHRPHRLHDRRRRDRGALRAAAPGYVALYIAFSRLRYSYKVEEDLRQALADAFGPIAFSTLGGLRRGHPAPLLLRRRAPRAPGGRRRGVRRMTERAGHHLGGPRGRGARGRRSASARAGGSSDRYVRPESRSGLYREATPPEEVPEDIQHLESLEGRLEVRRPAAHRGDGRR